MTDVRKYAIVCIEGLPHIIHIFLAGLLVISFTHFLVDVLDCFHAELSDFSCVEDVRDTAQGKRGTMANESNTAYDDVFRTTVNDCPMVCNELFNSGYTGNEIIVKTENEIFLHKQDGKEEKRITDTSIVIKRSVEDKGKGYHLECQSTKDGTLIIRMYEYDSQIALKNGELEEDTLTVRFPESAILYLRSDKKTPEYLWMKMETPGGIVTYPIPVMKIKKYTLDMIFEKELYFILPFYIFSYEKDLKKYEKNPSMLMQLQKKILDMRNRLQSCMEDGLIDEYIPSCEKEWKKRWVETFWSMKRRQF